MVVRLFLRVALTDSVWPGPVDPGINLLVFVTFSAPKRRISSKEVDVSWAPVHSVQSGNCTSCLPMSTSIGKRVVRSSADLKRLG